MKKIFTLLMIAFAAMTASTQNLTFKCEGKVINNGETFYSSSVNEVYASLGWLYFEPKIHIVSVTGGDVEVSAQSLDNKSLELCFGGTCVAGTSITNSSKIKPNEEVDIQLHANAQEAEIATYKVKLTAKCGSVVTSFTLVMSNDPKEETSIEEISNENGIISVNGKTLNYSFDHASRIEIDIFSLDGKKMMSNAVDTSKGSIDVSHLSNGIYLYRVTVGNNSISKKFIVE